VVILFSFPLLALPCLGAIDELIFSPDRWEFSYCRRSAIMLVVVSCQFTVALFVTDISVPLGIAGSTGCVFLYSCLPPPSIMCWVQAWKPSCESCHQLPASCVGIFLFETNPLRLLLPASEPRTVLSVCLSYLYILTVRVHALQLSSASTSVESDACVYCLVYWCA
jgi:hypothetical protein